MAEARSARIPGSPWTVRLFETFPIPPAWTGLLISAGWILLYSIYGRGADWISFELFWSDLHFEILWAVIIGYLPTATAYSLRGAVRDLQAIRPVLRCSEAEFQEQLRAFGQFDARQLLASSIAGVALGLALPFAPGYWVETQPPVGDPNLTWNWLRNGVVYVLMFRTLYIEVVTAVRFSRIGSRWAKIDLLDLDPLAPLSRRGLRSVLFLTGAAVLFSLFFTAPWETRGLIGLGLVSFLGVAGAALLLPVLGAHRRIREVKHETLGRIHSEIRRRGDPTLEKRPDSQLAELIAYKGLVESVPTWPFDFSTLLRFALYVAVGLGSWLGGAFVERLVDSALG